MQLGGNAVQLLRLDCQHYDVATDTGGGNGFLAGDSELLAEPEIGLVLLDELNIVLKYGYLDLARVLEDIRLRPAMQHVVVTGRGAPAELVAAADTVTELSVVKHAFQSGVRAQKGVEF